MEAGLEVIGVVGYARQFAGNDGDPLACTGCWLSCEEAAKIGMAEKEGGECYVLGYGGRDLFFAFLLSLDVKGKYILGDL